MAQPKQNLKFTPPVKGTDELIAQGIEAANIMQAPVFNLAYRSTIASLQDQIINTQPHETQRREWLNLQVQALGAVLGELASFVGTAKELSAKAMSDEADRQRQQAEAQGFAPSEPGAGIDTGYNQAYTGR